MRVLYLGVFNGPEDEGLSQFSRRMHAHFSSELPVLAMGTREILTASGFRAARRFRPTIVHHLTGPTLRSLYTLAFLKRTLGGRPKTVSSATRPFLGKRMKALAKLAGPDLVLSQSAPWEAYFTDLGLETCFVPNGVDLERFQPTVPGERDKLRAKFGWQPDEQVLLHVGHLKANRGLDILADPILADHFRVVVIGSTAEPCDHALLDRLTSAGVSVIREFQPSIQEFYRAADCYIFPVTDGPDGLRDAYHSGGCVDTPLSVLEAMATDMPVISTRYGSLPRLFSPGNGLTYFDGSSDGLRLALQSYCQPPVVTRAMVTKLSWSNVWRDIHAAYRRL